MAECGREEHAAAADDRSLGRDARGSSAAGMASAPSSAGQASAARSPREAALMAECRANPPLSGLKCVWNGLS